MKNPKKPTRPAGGRTPAPANASGPELEVPPASSAENGPATVSPPVAAIATPTGPIPIRCRFDTLLALAQVRPHPQNPKKHPEPQVALFAEILRYQGLRRPLVISQASGFLVVGHGQLLALESLGAGQAPVEYQDFGSPAEELAHLLADNKLAELGVVGDEQLEALVRQLEADGISERMAAILRDLEAGEEEDRPAAGVYELVPTIDEAYNGVLIFTRTGQEWAALSTLLDLPKGLDRRGTVGLTQVLDFRRFNALWKSRS